MAKSEPTRAGMTDEGIHRAAIDAPRRHDGPISLSEPDPGWPQRFEDEAAAIHRVLRDRVSVLEHVGSTSVPGGLPAKPIIDIVMAVEDSADEGRYVPPLERIGYVLRVRERDWHEHRLLSPADGSVNLHVFSAGDSEIGRMIAFRDRLRADATARRRYARVKRELAARQWRYVQNYADAKSQVIAELIADR